MRTKAATNLPFVGSIMKCFRLSASSARLSSKGCPNEVMSRSKRRGLKPYRAVELDSPLNPSFNRSPTATARSNLAWSEA